MAPGHVHSVNVSDIRTVSYLGKSFTTAIFKKPVDQRVPIAGVNVGSDRQANLEVHGGPMRAAYAYAREDYQWWEQRLGRTLEPGRFGENLTLEMVDVNGALIGERWRVGSAVLEVTSPRVPCSKLAMTMEDPGFVRDFGKALRPGAYLAIVTEGDVARGDPVEVVHRPKHALTLAEMTRIYLFDHARAREMLVPELPPSFREWVEAQTDRTSPRD